MVLSAGGVSGQQNFPNKPIRIITSLPGGAGDFTARLIAQGISGTLGQPVIVDNRSSNITGETAMKALPDGHTLLLDGNSLWFTSLMQKTPYDVLRDFSPITLVLSSPTILVVHPSAAANSVKELIALAKAKPGALNYGSAGYASAPHFAMELFKSMTGVNIVRVAYKGPAFVITALLGGEVQLTFIDAASATPHMKSGKLRALGVTSAEPSALAPGLPTVAASGLPGYSAIGLSVIFVPAKTPGAIVNRLNQEIVRFLTRPDVKERFLGNGEEIIASSPEQAAAAVKSDMSKMGKVIKDAGIKVN
jgi:tripartite-type tricarboxylate transporter receptor subunit TctC